MSRTAQGLVNYCKAQLGKPYWWGTFGQVATPGLLSAKRQQYPAYYMADDFTGQFGQKVHDCVGLIKGYRWENSGYVAAQDVAVSGLYASCRRKGDLSNMPDIPGVCVFMKGLGHVGVYIGGGQVIEARGHDWGVVQTELGSRGWAMWGMPTWLDYSGAENITPPEPEKPTIPDKPKPTYYYRVRLGLLKGGMADEQVRRCQLLLNALGYDCGEADGEMGVRTINAVKLFQSHCGILADGEVGGDTWRKLLRGE